MLKKPTTIFRKQIRYDNPKIEYEKMEEILMTEKQKMIAGLIYDAYDEELIRERKEARRLVRLFNNTSEDETQERERLLKQLFGSTGNRLNIEPSFRCDYGYNIHVGENFFRQFRLCDPGWL